ncbi:SIS domain-containing protein [Deferrisoma camini]|uniref:SIS domain-containing protein n=1 Tax=Deferrisoma camini TaxID=1035120 RepID=UPI00046D6017|nr:SIS domain-containing protein [Deferrisoma camini]
MPAGFPPADAMGVELAEQPGVWRALLGRFAEARAAVGVALGGRPVERVVVAGCGDCHAAAEWAEWLWEPSLRVRGLSAMELSRARLHLLGPGTLLVALSVSGKTPRVLEAVACARAGGARVLGLTDHPASPLAREADAVFCLGASPPEALDRTDYKNPRAAVYSGYHRPVPQTKTFGAMQLALVAVGQALGAGEGGEAWGELPGVAGPAAEAAAAAGARAAAAARPGCRIAVAGTGPGLPAARFAAYKFLELVVPAGHGEIEEFCHTWYLTTEPGDLVLFLVHDEATYERVAEIVPVVEGEIGAVVQALCTWAPAGEAPGWAVGLPAVGGRVAGILLPFAAAHWVRAVARAWGVNTDRFRAGKDEERYVAGSTRMIRRSRLRVPGGGFPGRDDA